MVGAFSATIGGIHYFFVELPPLSNSVILHPLSSLVLSMIKSLSYQATSLPSHTLRLEAFSKFSTQSDHFPLHTCQGNYSFLKHQLSLPTADSWFEYSLEFQLLSSDYLLDTSTDTSNSLDQPLIITVNFVSAIINT